ncbi:hypothetical protein [Candidatus Methylopumilus universalis]|uniref:hypothetical protein n=1 Tax=Candidatus Methylopumilus universalis TaxID=2588536 RepID=UPI003BEF1B45
MKKISALFLLMTTLSCKSLMHGQEQPVHLIDSQNHIYMTTCSGTVETFGTCHQKAQKTCDKGYRLIEQKSDSSGVHREIKFQCKS